MKTLTFLFCFFFATRVASSQWQQTSGPSGGGVSDFAAIGNTIFTSSFAIGNGVYASTNNGASWHESGLQGITLNHIYANGNTLLVSSTKNAFTETDTLYRSSDGGKTWQSVINFPNIRNISSIYFYQSKWFIAVIGESPEGKFYSSTDDGLTWPDENTHKPANIDFTLPIHLSSIRDTLVAGLGSGASTIFFTKDGVLWNSVQATQDSINAVYSTTTDNGNIYLGGTGGVMISSNGSSWTYQGNIGLQNRRLESIIALAASNDHLIGISSLNNVYYSWDQAQNWTLYTNAGLPANVSFYFSAAYINGTFFIASTAGIFASNDDGTTWHFSSNGLNCADLLALTSYNGTIFSATEEGVFTSQNSGDSWNNPTSTQTLKDITVSGFYNNGSNLWAYGQGIYSWTGSQWQTIDGINQVLGVAAGNSGKMFAEYPALDFPSFIDPISDTSKLLATSNSGTSWESVMEFPNSQDTAFTFVPNCMASNGSNILAMQRVLPYVTYINSYRLYQTTNNGNSWSVITIPHTPAFISYSGGAFYMGTYGDGLFRSDDNGSNWNPVGFNSKSDVTSILETQGVTFVSVTTDGSTPSGMYWNNGSGWKYANDGMRNISGFFAADKKFIYSGGPSVWKRSLSEFGINSVKEASNSVPLQYYPNPASSDINFTSTAPLEGTVILYDEKGIFIEQLSIETGVTHFAINLNTFSDGLYFARFLSKNGEVIANLHFLVVR